KLRLTSTLRLMPGETGITIHDDVENLSGNPGETQMLYHINFGAPIHTPGAEIIAAVKELVPRNAHAAAEIDSWNQFGPAEAGSEERVFFFSLAADDGGRTQTLLKSADASCGVCVGFNLTQLPHFSLWKNTPPLEDGYVTGLEPGTNFPNPRSFEGEKGRAVKLASGERVQYDLTVQFLPTSEQVAGTEQSIRLLQEAQPPTVYREPQPDWVAE
ncbi:MAG: DUF4432 family protein, partial [Planctomycetota bacterium]|nr:DUF4432 family protein [Planctomycetota bacterium]